MNFESISVEKLIDTYHKAKDAYYNTGKPILTDFEFDQLEEYLVSNQYIDKFVGTDIENVKGKKTPHVTPMLSLGKVQVFTETFEEEHFTEILKKLARYSNTVNTIGSTMLKAMHKLDGLAINITYYDGVLQSITTRGNGSIGTDVTNKIKHMVPNTLSVKYTGEVRGEIFVNKVTFMDKYANEFKNPRNLAAGIINSSDHRDPRIKDLSIFIFDCKGNLKTFGEIPDLQHLVIASSIFMNKFDETAAIYNKLRAERIELPYPTDGIVIRIASATEHMDNGHEPLHSIAVKFPPMVAITKIANIIWTLGKSGNFVPLAVLVPVELDGTIVTHVALHNYGQCVERGTWIGATVSVGKNGDIIPQIQDVIEGVEQTPESMNLPANVKVSENGKHLQSALDVSEQIARLKFISGLESLDMFGQKEKTLEKIYDLLEGKAENIFNNELFNKEHLYPIFGKGTSGVKFIKERLKRLEKGMSVQDILLMLQFDNCGDRHTKRLAPFYEAMEEDAPMITLDLSGLNRSVVEAVTENPENIDRVVKAIAAYKANGYTLIKPKIRVVQEGDITFEMTGSPKDAGYKTKDDFVNFVSTWIHTKLKKDTTYLITDDKESKTSKMKTAEKNGTKILTYEEATELFKDSLN